MTKEEILEYLHRIGIKEIKPPSKEYLLELHKAHVEKISWQTIDIFAGKLTTINVRDSVQLMIQQRSGYCFHLNGAFYELLRSLGFNVAIHRAGIQGRKSNPIIDSFHVGLMVAIDNNNGEKEKWLVDVGLGDMPYEPIPLQVGIYKQGPFSYYVKKSTVDNKGWRLESTHPGSYLGVDYAAEAVPGIEVFEPKHAYYSESKDSPWQNLFLIQNRQEAVWNELRGCMLQQRDAVNVQKTEITHKEQWFEVLSTVFNEQLVSYSNAEKDALWSKVKKLHETWKASKNNLSRN
ncbi:arylamine N-acetyltransferase family protein [Peribacillus sp. NPDC097895]|uniref:arylamine N-acetyltransferase family protein n=1 Tax=Peribacillus sp. NPDC097895 TaxID=3390619 RepID=UPI003CFE7AF2